MKKPSLSNTLFLAAAMLINSQNCFAASINYRDSKSFNFPNPGQTGIGYGYLFLPKFNSSLGLLTAASFFLEGKYGAFTFQALNSMLSQATAKTTITVTFAMTGIQGMSIDDRQSKYLEISVPAATSPYVADWGVAYVSDYVEAKKSKSFVFSDPPILSSFAGEGQIQFLFEVERNIDQTPGIIVSALKYPGEMRVTVTYGYTQVPISAALTVSKTGSGTVTSMPTGINCGADCSNSYAVGSSVTLTATPAAGYSFIGWGGGCTGANTTCTVFMTKDQNVTATFDWLQRSSWKRALFQ